MSDRAPDPHGAPRWARPTVPLGRRALPTYALAGVAGWAVAGILVTTLAGRAGVATGAVLAVVAVTPLVILGQAWLRMVIRGEERLTFLRHALAVLLVAGVGLALAGQPVLATLDVVAVGIAAFQVVARFGCLAVGCCHGRPADHGIRYGHAQEAEGLAPHLVGVRLLPVPLLESTACAAIVVAGAIRATPGREPGSVLVATTAAYCAVRLVLELVRGDLDRPHLRGVSAPQWACTATLVGLVVAGAVGALPSSPGVVVAAAAAVALVTGLVLWHGLPLTGRRLLAPAHVAELAGALSAAWAAGPSPGGGPSVRRTSEGLTVSGSVADAEGPVAVWAVSASGHPLREGPARAVARTVVRLRHQGADHAVVRTAHAHHVLVDLAPRAGARATALR